MLSGPGLKKNLSEVGKLTSDNEFTFEFSSYGFVVKDKVQRIIARKHKQGQLYALKDNVVSSKWVYRIKYKEGGSLKDSKRDQCS